MSNSIRPLVAGNWKMNGLAAALGEIDALKSKLTASAGVNAEVVICPPATLLERMSTATAGSPIATGGQDCHTASSGAHTGDISAQMLVDAGAQFVIVGHSERRADHDEDNGTVRAKAEAAIEAGLIPIICVGETETDREAGNANAVVGEQLAGSVGDKLSPHGLVIAYEPVWAIGTGKTATPDDIADMHAHIRSLLVERLGAEGEGARILYGGSVKPGNAAEILATANVNGALVGGASLKADDFFAVIAAA